MSRLTSSCAVALAVCWAAVAGSASAQSYPEHAIRFVIPYSPGGGADIVARLLAQKLSQAFKVPVVTDNRAGAGGVIGTKIVTDAAPDGYTLLLGNVGPLAISPSLHKKLPYRPLKDLAPVSLLAIYPNLLVVNTALPAKSLKEFLALAKARPGELAYASAGIGSSTHLAAELLFHLAGVRLTHVPYKDVGQAFVDILEGRTAAYLGSPLRALPFIKSGKLRPLAITSLERLRSQPSWPTIAESGFPGYEADNWLGLLVPAGTPAPIVERLNRAVVDAFGQADVQQQLESQAGQARTSSPRQFVKFIDSETRKWAKVVSDTGAKVD